MKEFGWTIEYTLSLSFPVFLDLFTLIRRVRCDAAIDEFFTPYGAAKYGGKCYKALFDGRGSIMLTDPSDSSVSHKVTREMTKRASLRLRKMIADRDAELVNAAK